MVSNHGARTLECQETLTQALAGMFILAKIEKAGAVPQNFCLFILVSCQLLEC